MTTALDIAAGLKLRVERVLPANSYFTDAGARVHLGKVHFDRNSDTFPVCTIGVPRTVPERIVTGTQTYTANRDFGVVAFMVNATDDYTSNPLAVQTDLERALLRQAPDDMLINILEDLEWVGSSIDYAPADSADFTRVTVVVRARYTETIGVTQP